MSFTFPDFDSDDDKISENEVGLASCSSQEIQPSPHNSDRLLKNLHLDLDALGGSLKYEVDRITSFLLL